MAFVALDKNLRLRDKEGELFYPVGINYVASYICTNFWEDFRPDVIYKDLKLAASLGVRAAHPHELGVHGAGGTGVQRGYLSDVRSVSGLVPGAGHVPDAMVSGRNRHAGL